MMERTQRTRRLASSGRAVNSLPISASSLISCLLVLLTPLWGLAQTEEAPERRLDLREIRTLRQRAEKNAALDEEFRARIIKLYDETIGSLEAARADTRQAAVFERERTGVGRMAEALRAELDRPQPEPRVRLPENTTVEQAEDALARERARLDAYRSSLRDIEQLAGERADARNEISRRLGALDQEIESLSDELLTATQRDLHPDLIQATRSSLLAQREAALASIEKLRAQLALLDARGVLIPGQIDQSQRRVADSEQLVAQLEKAARDLRRRAAAESLLQVRERSRQAAEVAGELSDIASETESFAVMLWGPEGVMIHAEETTNALAATRKHISDLDRITQLTRRKFEAVGYRGNIYRWWPEIPEGFPKPGDAAHIIRDLERRIPEVQHRLIRFEQERTKSRDLADRVLDDLSKQEDGGAATLRRASNLFDTRRDLLDELIRLYGRHSNQLVELETVSRNFLREREKLQSFLYERALWVRSVPRPVIPRPTDTASALLWLLSPESVGEVFRTAFGNALELPVRSLAVMALFGLLLGLRRQVRQRLEQLAVAVEKPASGSYRATLEALLHTVLLAAPVPLALYLGSKALLQAEGSLYLYSAAMALHYVAMIAALLEAGRQLLAPRGLAEAHFGWHSRTTRVLHEGLFWPEVAFLPLIYVALHFGMAGFRLSSPQDLQIHNNSLGRIAFVGAMVVLGSSLGRLFRPGSRKGSRSAAQPSAMLRRLYMYAYPLLGLTTFVPTVLAVLGFYITGYLLAYQMLQTLWIVVGVLFLSGLLSRWYTTSRYAASCASEEGDQAASGGLDSAEMDAQVRHLFRFVVILATAIGLYTVWSGTLPMVQIVKRVQIWPRIALLESTGPSRATSVTAAGAAGDAAASEAAAAGESGAKSTIPGVPLPSSAGSARGAGEQAGSAPLTLWGLLQSLLAVIITWMLVKNLPGLLALILQRRTSLDSGARIALSTLVRYTIIIFGVSIAFSLLGISWSKVQWLVAALTFGLGFGLQEIVANFVSGLILLMERPVRVGDAVTIGNLMGRVTRIQIRATTVTLWDHSEMIVPNKEFITSKLINWTLSDSKRRIDIPLRVAYGSDLQKVKETLIHVAQQHPDVVDDPPPQALVLDFGDDAVKFELRFFVDFGQGLATKDDIQMAIDRAFREQNIEFALPQMNLQLARKREIPGASGPKPSPGESAG